MDCDKLLLPCNPYYNQAIDISITIRISLVILYDESFPPPQPRATINLTSVPMALPFP